MSACSHPLSAQYHDAVRGSTMCTICGDCVQDQLFELDPIFERGAGGGGGRAGNAMGRGGGGGGALRNLGGSIRPTRTTGDGTILVHNHRPTIDAARREMSNIARQLEIDNDTVEVALGIYTQALRSHIVSGTRAVVLRACLYAACRRRRTPHIIYDFVEETGESAHAILTHMKLICEGTRTEVPVIDPSCLVQRLAEQMQLGDHTQDVVVCALKVLRAMRDDWIACGRRPMGVCASALLVGCYVFGISRSPEQVCGLARLTANTISKRLMEFSATPAAELDSIDDYQPSNSTLPPAFNDSSRKSTEEDMGADMRELSALYYELVAEAKTSTPATPERCAKWRRFLEKHCEMENQQAKPGNLDLAALSPAEQLRILGLPHTKPIPREVVEQSVKMEEVKMTLKVEEDSQRSMLRELVGGGAGGGGGGGVGGGSSSGGPPGEMVPQGGPRVDLDDPAQMSELTDRYRALLEQDPEVRGLRQDFDLRDGGADKDDEDFYFGDGLGVGPTQNTGPLAGAAPAVRGPELPLSPAPIDPDAHRALLYEILRDRERRHALPWEICVLAPPDEDSAADLLPYLVLDNEERVRRERVGRAMYKAEWDRGRPRTLAEMRQLEESRALKRRRRHVITQPVPLTHALERALQGRGAATISVPRIGELIPGLFEDDEVGEDASFVALARLSAVSRRNPEEAAAWMEGKNCFRSRWAQEPIFSGGNIASLALPLCTFDALRTQQQQQSTEAMPGATAGSSAPASLAHEECLVMACGDTINVVRAATGEVVCRYTLPVEDVILHLDAVSVLTEDTPVSFGERARTLAASAETVEEAQPSPKRKGTVATTKVGAAVTVAASTGAKVKLEEVSEESGVAPAAANPELVVPLGCYVACGTRALQLYLLTVVVSERVPLSSATAGVAGESSSAPAASGAPTPLLGYELRVLRSWTAAQQAISIVSFSRGGRFLIAGSTDGSVRVWNAFHHHLTHNFRCPSAGILQTVHLSPSESLLVTGSFEGHVTVFDFVEKTLLAHSRPHVQAVDAIAVTEDGARVLSIARDRRLSIQTLTAGQAQGRRQTWSLTEERAVVVREHLSAALFESPQTLHMGSMDGIITTYRVDVSGGPGAALSVVCRSTKPPASNAEDTGEESMVKCLLVCGKPKGTVSSPTLKGFSVADTAETHLSPLYVADAGYNVARMEYNGAANQYRTTDTLVGFLDQILDIKLFPESRPTAGFPYDRVVVTNSKDVRLYGARGCLSGQALQGHRDVVMCCAVSSDGSLVATGGKDMEVRFWSTSTFETVARGVRGHTAEITSMCFNAKQTESYLLLFTISADENLRLWDVGQSVVPQLTAAKRAMVEFESRAGINAAHAGPVFALAVAPNDQYVATGGKDKVVSLWNISGKKIFKDATLKGHRRGISSLAFSPADRVLASASNDGAVRLWSLVSLSCVKALQVDKVAVLQAAFFNGGTQLVTANAEGVLRVWAVASSEAVWAGELHQEKVWALSVRERDGEIVFFSGAADGVLAATEDYTAEEVDRVRQERHDVILKEQALSNAIRKGEFSEAVLLALQLNHPRHLRQVLVRWCAVDAAQCEDTLRTTLLPGLDDEQTVRLLQFTREWMTNSRHCTVASLVVYCFLGSQHFAELAKLPPMVALVEPLLAYSQRHSSRQHDLLRRTYYIDYVAQAGASAGGSGAQRTLTSMPPFVDATGRRLLADAVPTGCGVSKQHQKRRQTASEPVAKKARA